MTTCPYCGGQNPQPDAQYCSYCGSSLAGAQNAPTPKSSPPSVSTPRGSSGYSSSGSSFQSSERYEKALKRTEQLGIIVVILAVIALIIGFV